MKNTTKLYWFDPCGYGQQYFVCAENPEYALVSLLKYLNKQGYFTFPFNQIKEFMYGDWKNATVEELPYGYKLREFNSGEVIQSEIC